VDRDQNIEWAARAGYTARGVVYLLVGGFAVEAALGSGERARGTEQALSSVANEPWSAFLLGAIAVGLFGYALWRLLQSVLDVDDHGTDLKGLAVRGGLIVSASSHALLGAYAAHRGLGISLGGAESQSSTSQRVAEILALPAGRWLVAGIAIAIAGAGLAQVYKGWRGPFERWRHMDARTARWAKPVCRFGLIARGFVFVIIGGMIAQAAIRMRSAEAGDLADAMTALQTSPYGGLLFSVVALGLLSFGVYSVIEAVYRRVQTHRIGEGKMSSLSGTT
jgi:hypothetical protein